MGRGYCQDRESGSRTEDRWNVLSSCEDGDTADLQAFRDTRTLVESIGREDIIRLLYLNRTHYVDWNELLRKADATAPDKSADARVQPMVRFAKSGGVPWPRRK